jgi:hypothetical protein
VVALLHFLLYSHRRCLCRLRPLLISTPGWSALRLPTCLCWVTLRAPRPFRGGRQAWMASNGRTLSSSPPTLWCCRCRVAGLPFVIRSRHGGGLAAALSGRWSSADHRNAFSTTCLTAIDPRSLAD